MSTELRRVEASIYFLRLWGYCTLAEIEAVQAEGEVSWAEYDEKVRVVIIERDTSTILRLSFANIRYLISRQNMQQIYLIHLQTSTQVRFIISTLNNILPMKIELADDYDLALIRARQIVEDRNSSEDED